MLGCLIVGASLAIHYGDELFRVGSSRLGTMEWHWVKGIGGSLVGFGVFVLGMRVVRLR